MAAGHEAPGTRRRCASVRRAVLQTSARRMAVAGDVEVPMWSGNVKPPPSRRRWRAGSDAPNCDGLSVAGINVWTGCWGGSCRAKRCGRVCAETACRSTSGLAPSRAVTCDVSRANQSVPGIRAARSRVARIVLRTRVPRGAMHSDVHLTLYGAGAQNQRSSTGEILKLSQARRGDVGPHGQKP